MKRLEGMSRQGLAVFALMLCGGVGAQGVGSEQALAAQGEVFALLPSARCAAPEVWTVPGDVASAARFLVSRLDERGWAVVQGGVTPHGYAVIADPDPESPNAVAVGGLLSDQLVPNNSVAFIARCVVLPTDGEGGLYTRLPTALRRG